MPEVVCPSCGGGFPPRLFIAQACPWCGQQLITARAPDDGGEAGDQGKDVGLEDIEEAVQGDE